MAMDISDKIANESIYRASQSDLALNALKSELFDQYKNSEKPGALTAITRMNEVAAKIQSYKIRPELKNI